MPPKKRVKADDDAPAAAAPAAAAGVFDGVVALVVGDLSKVREPHRFNS